MTLEEKLCGKCNSVKAIGEFYPHKRDGYLSWCKSCYKTVTYAWQEKNLEKKRESYRKWRAKNTEAARAASRKWNAANKPAKAAHSSAYEAQKRKAIPAWANRFFIDEAYRLAELRTKMLGFAWNVDHIVPLIHPKVCGLHVHNNLRVIPATENIAKGNRYWPDMP